ncbi:MAG: ABC transporter permease [Bacteroidales bacterium]|jgi:ABC-2 type transport system permease protein|nr:ABC transporter permease [Bacteroidales bacterium]
MNGLRWLIYKDGLLLLRDKAGLCMMFLMPMLLALIMTYLQDSTFNAIHETRIPLLLLNADKDSLGMAIERQIGASGIFSVATGIDGQPAERDALIKAVGRGDFMMGIIIPENATNHIRKNVKRYVAGAFSGKNISLKSDSVQVEIFIDPVTKNSFRSTLISTLREYAVRTESDFLFREITAEVNKHSPLPAPDIRLARNKVILKEQYAMPDKAKTIPNSTQHNIPAWGMFAVFFIAVSLSGNLIRERGDGSFTRLRTMPCPYYLYMSAKVIIYSLVCLLQLAAIFLMGLFLFPLLGLPALTIGNGWLSLLGVGLCSALAAIGYGTIIGQIASSHQQAAVFASVSVVIMAAIGGIWIPVFVMPLPMQWLSACSPLNWGLEGFYDILIRGGNWRALLPECAASSAFFILCAIAAVVYDKKKRIDI